MNAFDGIWQEVDAQVGTGRFPGYAAAVAIDDAQEVRLGGLASVDGEPVREDTLFRIASLTKPMGGVLTLRLLELGVLSLSDPIARWLPEAAAPMVVGERVLQPAATEITVRHLLNGTSGWGCVLEGPLQEAMTAAGVFPSVLPRLLTADEFVAGVCSVPLAFEPGTGWLYETGMDLLGVLLTRATGRSLGSLFAEYVFEPLGMGSTAFVGEAARLTTLYWPSEGALDAIDPPDGVFSRPPALEELSSGLVSTVGDVFRFMTAMRAGGSPVLSPSSFQALTRDELSPAVRAGGAPLLAPGESWGLGVGVDAAVESPYQAIGRWGWTGGSGTTAYVDPVRGTVCVLLTQRAMAGPQDGFEYFWNAVARAATVR